MTRIDCSTRVGILSPDEGLMLKEITAIDKVRSERRSLQMNYATICGRSGHVE